MNRLQITLVTLVKLVCLCIVAAPLLLTVSKSTGQMLPLCFDNPNDPICMPAASWNNYKCVNMTCPGGPKRYPDGNYYDCWETIFGWCFGSCHVCTAVGAGVGMFCTPTRNDQCIVGFTGLPPVPCGTITYASCTSTAPPTPPMFPPPNGCYCSAGGTASTTACMVGQCI